jgi:large subunit ribosomal protein L17
MRHANKNNHLGRTAPHRKAMLSNMAASLILHKRITTTVAKAKALKKYVEPLITKSKSDTTHSRRIVFSYLQDKVSTQVLFDEVSEKIAERPGGYTRIIKLGNRLGDNADMCLIELVDYNDVYQQEEEKKTRTRRSRRGGKKGKTSTEEASSSSSSKSKKEEAAQKADTKAEDTTDSQDDVNKSNDNDSSESEEKQQ